MNDREDKKGKPQEGKTYVLFGGPDTPCIAAGNTWEDSVVDPDEEEVSDEDNHTRQPAQAEGEHEGRDERPSADSEGLQE
jgi:hypothetical protein